MSLSLAVSKILSSSFSGFAAFLGLEVKNNGGLDVFDTGQNLIVLGA